MLNGLSTYAPQTLALTRIVVGASFATHGAQKVLGAFGGTPPGAPALIVWVAGGIELVGGVLIGVGLLTRGAAFLSSGLMAAAYFMAHASKGFWPLLNGGELAMLYAFILLLIAALGPGTWALDNLRVRQPRVALRAASW